MEPIGTYDYLVRSRAMVLDRVRELPEARIRQAIPGWKRTLAETLTHIYVAEWYYVLRLEQREVPPFDEWIIRDEAPPPFGQLEAAWSAQAALTRSALGSVRDWEAEIEYRVTVDDHEEVISARSRDVFTQLVLHEIHHRAQAMNMLQQLGQPAGDLDYNLLTYGRRALTED